MGKVDVFVTRGTRSACRFAGRVTSAIVLYQREATEQHMMASEWCLPEVRTYD